MKDELTNELNAADLALRIYLNKDIELLRQQSDLFVDEFLYGFIHNHYAVNEDDCALKYNAIHAASKEEKISWIAQRLNTPRVFMSQFI